MKIKPPGDLQSHRLYREGEKKNLLERPHYVKLFPIWLEWDFEKGLNSNKGLA